MMICNRRNSWQLWENYSHVAVDVGNISQVCDFFILLVKMTLNTWWNIVFAVSLHVLCLVCHHCKAMFGLKWNMMISIIIVLFKIWWNVLNFALWYGINLIFKRFLIVMTILLGHPSMICDKHPSTWGTLP